MKLQLFFPTPRLEKYLLQFKKEKGDAGNGLYGCVPSGLIKKPVQDDYTGSSQRIFFTHLHVFQHGRMSAPRGQILHTSILFLILLPYSVQIDRDE